MAITQVGSATSATSSTAVTGLDFAVPTGIQAGDVLIATFTCNSADETRLASRWIALDVQNVAGGTFATTVAIKIADGADSGNYNFGIWQGTSMMVITCTAWRGVSPAWPCEFGESAHTGFATGQSEPVTTPTVSGSSVDAGRVLYIRTSRDNSTTAITHSESTAGVSELVDTGTGASSVSYSAAQYADDSDFSGSGSKSGLAITASASETHGTAHTIVLRAAGDEQAWTLDGTTTWTRPSADVTEVSVECWGGGGGGGAGTANPGSGGGGAGGSYAIKPNFAVDGSSHTVTVASPVGNATGSGSTGQTTWFKSNDSSGVVAVGGPGGAVGSSTSTGGAGGTGTTTGCQGDTVFAGGNGSTVNPDLGGSAGGGGASPAGAGNSASASTPGATKQHGGGTGGYGRAADTAGHQGMWYGGAGAGGNTTNSGNQNGGWGGGGLVRIIYIPEAATAPDAGSAAGAATANDATGTGSPGSIVQVGSADSGGATAASEVVLDKPTGVTTGDFLIAFVNFVDVHTLGTPSGWTLVESTLGAASSLRNSFFTKVAGGSEPATYTFSTGEGNEGIINGGIVALRDTGGRDLELHVREVDSPGSGQNVDTPGATATKPGRVFHYRSARFNTGAAASFTQSFGTELWDVSHDGGGAEYGQTLAMGATDVAEGTHAGITINSTDSATINIMRTFVIAHDVTHTDGEPGNALGATVANDTDAGLDSLPSTATALTVANDADTTLASTPTPNTAAATASAPGPGVGLGIGSAASTATANDATGSVGASADAATSLAAAADASVDIRYDIGNAAATATASDATAQLGTLAPAGAAESTATANGVTSDIESPEAFPGAAEAEVVSGDVSATLTIDLESGADMAASVPDTVALTGAETGAADLAAVAFDASVDILYDIGNAAASATANNPDIDASFVDGPGVGEVTAYDATALVGGSPEAAGVSASADTGESDQDVLPSNALAMIISNDVVGALGTLPEFAPVEAVAGQLAGNGLFPPTGVAAMTSTANTASVVTVTFASPAVAVMTSGNPLASIDFGPPDFRTLGILRELRVYEVEEPD